MASQLTRAIASGNIAELEDALDELELDGLSPDSFDTPYNEQHGITPLLAAVSSQHASSVAVAEALLERGASLEKRSAVGSSALHFAVRGGSPACVAMLLRRDPALALLPNKAGDLPLFFALSEGFLRIGALLLDGDRVAAEAQARAANDAGTTAMMIAARSIGDTDADARVRCAQLIDLGADVAAVDSAGRTALHYAASAGSPAWVRALLAFGADATANMRRGARTPLALARERAEAVAVTATAGESAARRTVVEALTAAEVAALKARETKARAMAQQLLAEEDYALKSRASSGARAVTKKKNKKKKKKQKKRERQQQQQQPPLPPPLTEASAEAANHATESSSSDGDSLNVARAARAPAVQTSPGAQASLRASRPVAVPTDADDARPGEWSVAAAARRRTPKPTPRGKVKAAASGRKNTRAKPKGAPPRSPAATPASAPAAKRSPSRQRGARAAAAAAAAAGRTPAAPISQRGWGAPTPPRSSGATLSIAESVAVASPAAAVRLHLSDLARTNGQLFARHPLLCALDLDCRHVCGAVPAAGALSLSQIEALVEVHKQQLHALLDARVAIEEQQHLVASLERRRIEAEYSAIASLKGQGARATSF